MRTSKRLAAWSAFSAALVLASVSFAATAAEPAKPGAGNATASDAMAQEMMKMAAPGEHHKRLDSFAGKWTTQMKMWMAPNSPPVETSGTMESSWIMGGRYIVSRHSGSFMGMPFEGQATDGYDNVANKYVESWVDNMGTGILNLTGTCDADCKVLTETGEMSDPATGKMVTYKAVTTFIDANSYRYEAFAVNASGSSTKMMEMTATRKH